MKTMDTDTDLEIDPAVERVLCQRLTELAGAAVVPPDGWEKLRERTEAGGVPSRWGRRRLIAAAAVLLVLVGSVVTDDPDGGRDRVSTDDSPSTTVERRSDDDDRRTGADREDSDEVRTVHPDRDPSPVTPGSRSPDDGRGAPDSAAPAPGASPDDVSRGAGSGRGSPNPSPSPSPSPAPTTPGSTTTTTPPPPPRTPGDVTVTTSSGFSVEVVVQGDGADYLMYWLRRTDSQYTGSSQSGMFPADGYFPLNIVFASTSYTVNDATGESVAHEPRGRQCVSFNTFTGTSVAPHEFVFGLVGADVATVRVHMADGGVHTASLSDRIVGDFHAYLVEAAGEVARVEGYDASGQLLNTAVDSTRIGQGGGVGCSVDVPGRQPPPM
jgi:hypothetical protein